MEPNENISINTDIDDDLIKLTKWASSENESSYNRRQDSSTHTGTTERHITNSDENTIIPYSISNNDINSTNQSENVTLARASSRVQRSTILNYNIGDDINRIDTGSVRVRGRHEASDYNFSNGSGLTSKTGSNCRQNLLSSDDRHEPSNSIISDMNPSSFNLMPSNLHLPGTSGILETRTDDIDRLLIPSHSGSRRSRNSSFASTSSFNSHGIVDSNANIIRIVVSSNDQTGSEGGISSTVRVSNRFTTTPILDDLTHSNVISNQSAELNHLSRPPDSMILSPSDYLNIPNSSRSIDTNSWNSHENNVNSDLLSINSNLDEDIPEDTQTVLDYDFDVPSIPDISLINNPQSPPPGDLIPNNETNESTVRPNDVQEITSSENYDEFLLIPSNHNDSENSGYDGHLDTESSQGIENFPLNEERNFMPETSFHNGIRTATKIFCSVNKYKRRLSEPNRTYSPTNTAISLMNRSSVHPLGTTSTDIPRTHSPRPSTNANENVSDGTRAAIRR